PDAHTARHRAAAAPTRSPSASARSPSPTRSASAPGRAAAGPPSAARTASRPAAARAWRGRSGGVWRGATFTGDERRETRDAEARAPIAYDGDRRNASFQGELRRSAFPSLVSRLPFLASRPPPITHPMHRLDRIELAIERE